MFIKNIRLHEELFPPHSVTNAARPSPERPDPLPTRVIAAKPLLSVPERVRSYSKNLTLVALHKSEGTPFNSDADHPVQWRGVVSNTDSKCPYPKQELCKLLGEGAIEQVSESRQDGCFVQPLFGVPKREGGLCPILDLGPINRALGKRPFGMLTLKQILAQIRPGDWFASVDLKDAYFHIQIAPHHRRFSEVCCQLSRKSTAFQYSVLSSGLLWPHALSKCINAALPP